MRHFASLSVTFTTFTPNKIGVGVHPASCHVFAISGVFTCLDHVKPIALSGVIICPVLAPKSNGLPWASSFSWRPKGGESPFSDPNITKNRWCVNPIHITVISHQYHVISWIPHPDVRFLSSTETSHPSTQEALEESQGRLFLRIAGELFRGKGAVHSLRRETSLDFRVYDIYIYIYI